MLHFFQFKSLRQAPLPERCCSHFRLLRPPPRPHPLSVPHRKIHIDDPGSPGKPKSFIRWGNIVDNWFVRNAYDLPVLKANGRREYSDEFEKAYLEYFNERKEDLE